MYNVRAAKTPKRFSVCSGELYGVINLLSPSMKKEGV